MPKIRHRSVAAIAATALTALSFAVLASPASAAVTTSTVLAQSQTTISAGNGASGQAAGDWTITQAGGSNGNGDTIVLTVGSPTNCVAANDTIGFAAVPTVTVSAPATGTPTFTAALSSVGSPCTTTGTKNTLTLSANNASGSVPSTITVTNVLYTTGSAVAAGPVVVVPTGTAGAVACSATLPGCSNAVVALAVFSANSPPSPIGIGTGEAVSNFVITESKPGTVTGWVCFDIQGTHTTFTPLTATDHPAAAASGGGAAVGQPIDGLPATLGFQVTTPSSTTPATFTVSNIKLNATAVEPILVNAGMAPTSSAACADAASAAPTIGKNVPAGGVINASRAAGSNRFDTARLIGDTSFPCAGTPTAARFAIVARGDLFADALAGAFLAGQRHAPILLTHTGSLPPETVTAFHDMGINQVFVLGLQGAVSDAVVSAIQATQAVDCTGVGVTNNGSPVNISVQRIGGVDRYETARLVAENGGLGGAGTLASGGFTGTGVKTAVVADGLNFPDALSTGPMAFAGSAAGNGAGGLPLLLTDTNTLSAGASEALSDLGIKQVIIPGGSAAVSTAVEQAIQGMGITTIRIAGADRTATAAQVAAFEISTPTATTGGMGYNRTVINLARGDDFADALAGGPAAGLIRSPIVLASNPNDLGTTTPLYLGTFGEVHTAGGINTLLAFGGTAAIAASTFSAAEQAIVST
jgi:hypothetical protein